MSAPSLLRALALPAAAAALSGALLFLGTGLHPVWWLTWLAPIPVAWTAPRVGAWPAAAAAAVAWIAGGLNGWAYLRALHLPGVVAVLAIVGPALVFALAVALLRALALRGSAIRAALALPAVWVAYEFVQARTGSQGTFGSLAYTQVENLPLLQLASAAGIWGMTFAVLFFSSAVAVALSCAVPWPRRARLLGLSAAAALAIGGHAAVRLHAPQPSGHVTVGLAASDASGDVSPERMAHGGRLLRAYLTEAEALAAGGARLVVLPEKLVQVQGPDLPAIDAAVQAVADRTGATVVLGMIRTEGGATLNEARVYRPGAAASSYRKRRLLPGWEDRFTKGEQGLVVQDGAGSWGLAICKDMDFPDTARAYRDGVDLLVVPAWDFERDGWLHARMAVVRGVEVGLGVVRSAKQGLLTAADGRGRILAERSSAGPSFSRLVVDVPLHRERTPYARLGDLLAWADLALLAALALSLRRRPAALAPHPA
jgi:apolipoprotein N-acyltransferase